MKRFIQTCILISILMVSSALFIVNSATTNACRDRRNHRPKLLDGQVTPLQGDQTTLFTYTVNYTDRDNDEPKFVFLITKCRLYRMQKQDPSDNDYTDGCIYTYSRYLNPGQYRYFFICSDGKRIAWTRIKCGPTVFCNEPPVLCDGKVSPEEGERSLDVFNFTVNYADVNNHAPEFLNITLDGKNYTMVKSDTDDNNYIDGCIYYYATTLEALGTHQFRFYTSDGSFWVFSDIFSGPTVHDTIAPDLMCSSPLNTTYTSGIIDIEVSSNADDVDKFWFTLYDVSNGQWIGYQNGTIITEGHETVDLGTGFYLINVSVNDTAGNINSTDIYFTVANPPVLSDDQVSPAIGDRWFTLFNFSVIYTDEDNNPPSFLNITLDGINYTMIKADMDDNNYVDGCVYYYETTLEALGTHQFRFYTSDGIYWTFTDIIPGPTVQDTIVPDLDCLSPLNTTYIPGMIDIIVSSSAIDVDAYWYTLYDVTNGQWIGSQDGIIIEDGHGTVQLGTSYYLINVFVNDTAGNINSTAVYFTVGTQPMLSGGQVLPSTGERWLTLFEFTVKYTDEDNDQPLFMKIILDGVDYTMLKADSEDKNFIDGCIYYYTTTIQELGEHQFSFSTSDGKYQIESNTFSFTVIDTTPPDLSINSPLNTTYTSGDIHIDVSSNALDVDSFWFTLYSVSGEEWIGNQNGILIENGQSTIDLEDGFYFLTAFINDTEGNINEESIYFTVYTEIFPMSPPIGWIIFGIAATIGGSAFVSYVVIKRRKSKSLKYQYDKVVGKKAGVLAAFKDKFTKKSKQIEDAMDRSKPTPTKEPTEQEEITPEPSGEEKP